MKGSYQRTTEIKNKTSNSLLKRWDKRKRMLARLKVKNSNTNK